MEIHIKKMALATLFHEEGVASRSGKGEDRQGSKGTRLGYAREVQITLLGGYWSHTTAQGLDDYQRSHDYDNDRPPRDLFTIDCFGNHGHAPEK